MPINIPTNLLRSFVAVAEWGSVTHAGDKIGRSQPAISLQIKKLEELLEVTLFDRRERKLILTDRGKILLKYAEQMLASNDEAVNRLLHPSLNGNVHLGVPNEFASSYFLPTVLRKYARTHTDVTVQVSCDLSVNLNTRLQAGEFDLILTLQDEPGQLPTPCKWNEKAVWVSTTGSQIHKLRPLPIIVAPEGCVYRDRMIATLNSAGIPWRLAYTSANFGGILAGVTADLGITAVAKSAISGVLKPLGTLEQLPALPDLQMQLMHTRNRCSPAIKRLIEDITEQINPST